MVTPDFEAAKSYVFGRMERELPANLFYHGLHHTRDDVLPVAERLAKLQGIQEGNLLVLKTAALYHDVGFVKQYAKNEPIAVEIAKETLPSFGYSSEYIDRVGQIIMPTQLQNVNGKFIQVPDLSDILQQLMCDADLDVLGRDDFLEVNLSLKKELKAYGTHSTFREWYEGQLAFLKAHHYFTAAAKSLRDEGKQRNIGILETMLAMGKSPLF